MDFAASIMDFSTIDNANIPIHHEERFRTPCRAERDIGLWADRIGCAVEKGSPNALRRLGQYGAVYIERGSGEFVSETTGRVSVAAGEVMLLFPEEPHMYYSVNGWLTKWIVWNGSEAPMLEALGYISKSSSVIVDSYGVMDRAYQALDGIMGSEDIAAILQRKNIILHMVLELFALSRQSGLADKNERVVANVVEFLNENYRETFSISELADRFHLSETHFRRLFKAYTGRSPREFVTAARMSEAKRLLSNGAAIKEVARLVGYDDMFYFMRVFKRTTGMSAGRFGPVSK